MRIKIINPNTSASMTEAIGRVAKKYARPGTAIFAVSPKRGPESIESYYDETLAGPGILEEIRLGIQEGFDGYIIACFGDPALFAAREVAEAPVIGIGEASMNIATMLGYKFSILAVLKNAIPIMEDMVNRYGQSSRCASIRSIDIPVLEIEKNPERVKEALVEEGKKAIEEDRAEVLLLGCAGMADLDTYVEERLHVPVIDGVVAAVKLLEAVGEYGKKTSKALMFQHPRRKKILGFDEALQL